jgi:hypothetical protein
VPRKSGVPERPAYFACSTPQQYRPWAKALAESDASVRQEGLGVIWSILFFEPSPLIRRSLAEAWTDLAVVLGDRRPLIDMTRCQAAAKRDFRGRVGDLAFLVVRGLLDRDFDQSEFRALTPEERDRELRC